MINNIPFFYGITDTPLHCSGISISDVWQITAPKSAFAYVYTLAKSTGKKPTQNN
jgi:hypothetical protein